MRVLEENWQREEFWRRIGEAAAAIGAAPGAMLLEYYRDEIEIADLASAYGRSPDALTQSLYRSRRRLRELLEGAGWTEAALRLLLAE